MGLRIMLIIDQLKGFETPRYRIQGVKGSRVQTKYSGNKPLNPRTLEPLNPHGMTLIEVILVMVIIGILAAIVLPRIDFGITSSRTSVDGAAYMIASDIRYTQEFAMSNRVSKSIEFTTTHPTYYTFNPVSTGMDPSGQLQPLGATISTTVTFTFNSLGEPTTGGGSSVIVSAGGVIRTITVLQYTGKVNIS
jgi:prepilin-type N-terminal cleavage/methylation domain-containing protein